jgi:hypothetical protein
MQTQINPATVDGRSQPPRTQHIHAILYVEKTRAMARLGEMQCAQYRKTKFRHTRTSDALWAGMCALKDRCDELAACAQKHGLLLMCWEGSRVTEITNNEEVAA